MNSDRPDGQGQFRRGDGPNEQDRTVMAGGGADGSGYLSAGATIDGTYKVLSFLGAGAAGQVYKVEHIIMGKTYALKILMGTEVSPIALQRFKTEIQVISRLSHPNVVQVHNSGVHNGSMPYYVMDLIEGATLADMIEASRKQGLPLLETLDMFAAVAHALAAAHEKNIVHRDIKPGNIVLSNDTAPIGDRVKVVDFGIAKLTGRDNGQALTSKGEIFGSPLYMSPEQCMGGRIDARSDIYSLGCTLFEALTGSPPFQGKNIVETFTLHMEAPPPRLSDRQPGRKYPAALEELISQLLEKLPDDRCQNMLQVVEILETIREEASPKKDQAMQSQTKRIRRPAAKPVTVEEQKPLKAVVILSVGLVLGTALTGLILLKSDLLPWTKKSTGAVPLGSGAIEHDIKIVDASSQLVETAKREKESALSGTGSRSEKTSSALSADKITPGCFYTGIIKQYGTTFDHYKFPNKKSAGFVSYHEVIDTRGTVTKETSPSQEKGDRLAGGIDDISLFTKIVDDNAKSKKANAIIKESMDVMPGARMFYTPLRIALENPSYMTGFRKQDITGLSLAGVKKNVDKLLSTAANYFINLEAIDLENSAADDRAVETLNKLPKLVYLKTAGSKVSPKALAKLTCLPHLFTFSLSHLGRESGTILTKLQSSNKVLNELEISDSPIHKAELAVLVSIPSLKTLVLRNTQTKAKDLEALQHYRGSLKVLNCTVEPEASAEILTQMPLAYAQLGNKKWNEETNSKVLNILAKRFTRRYCSIEVETGAENPALYRE
ncbi:MAG: serine/threonine protein kinase [Candidatus Obscuribacter sp.]|nr:serine/threonine protein kinase [Candidatus Obscuribacter sp.]